MADYISREAADKALTIAAAADKDKNRRIWAKAICVLHDLPAADVELVRHSYWESYDTSQYMGTDKFGEPKMTMAQRLIDADALPKMFDAEYKQTMKLIWGGETHLDNLAEGFAEAIRVVKYIAPTVDAVPVVRCRECKYYAPEDEDGISCHAYGGMTDPFEDAFCSQGVRRMSDEKRQMPD